MSGALVQEHKRRERGDQSNVIRPQIPLFKVLYPFLKHRALDRSRTWHN